MNLKKLRLDPIPTHPNEEATEKKIFFPKWNCFCCEDTGIVRSHLARIVMPEFNWSRDKLPVCNNCQSILKYPAYRQFGILDNRFSLKICAELDKKSREDWAVFSKNQQGNLLAKKAQQAAIELAQSKSLRKCDTQSAMPEAYRTPHEDLSRYQKHQWMRENWDLDLKTEGLENEYAN